MRILVVGGGGREHALAWKLAQHHEVWCAPGNAGIAETARCIDLKPGNIKALAELAGREAVDLTVVGPEAPLVDGIADEFQGRGLKLFGPSREAARIEGDKSFAKQLMKESGIPTAGFGTFDAYDAARTYAAGLGPPLVVKASGLAAGKGVLICPERDDVERALREVMVEGRFGEAGKRVVIEEYLTGEEASMIGLCDGRRVEVMVASQDHKRLLDGDRGPNTGGMGAYAPAPVVTSQVEAEVGERVFGPLLTGLRRLGIEYRGVIYAGMMLTDRGLYVLEFNCRFGDPETQAVLPLMEGDLGELLLACADGDLGDRRVVFSGDAAMCVVVASDGYPGEYRKGVRIEGSITEEDGAVVFHAGTRLAGGQVVTNGGRVLGVTGIGADLEQARDRAYQAVEGIRFEGMFYRRDIGQRGLARLEA